MDERLNEEVKKILEEFTTMLSNISFADVEIVEAKDVLSEDKPMDMDHDFRKIFLENANSSDGYIHTEKASWSKK